MRDIDISTVICCYHGVKTVQNAIESIVNQNYDRTKHELIIIDNGSIDGSESKINESINRYNESINIRKIRIQNKGLSNARNIGWENAKGKIVFYMDDDAYADKNCLDLIIKTFNNNKNINVVGGKVDILNTENEFANLYHYSIFNFWMYKRDLIIGTNMSFKRDFLKKANGFIESFLYRGDESAFFEKNKEVLHTRINREIVIYHTQPEGYKQFFKSRYQNGEGKLKVLKMNGIDRTNINKIILNLVIRLFSLISVLILLICIVTGNYTNIYLSVSISLIVIRNLVQPDMIGSIKSYSNYMNRQKVSRTYPIAKIIYMIFVGNILEDIGYLKNSL